MPTQQIIETFKFEELDNAAKERARAWWRTLEASDFETDYDDFTECARIIGITFNTRPIKLMGGGTRTEPCIYWSGFSSQGDGASFEGRYGYAKGASKAIRAHAPKDSELHRIADQLQAIQVKHFYRLEARCTQGAGSNFYSHSGTMAVETYDSRDEYRAIGNADETVKQLLRDFADWIYRQLEREYEWRMSDEQVDDAITANEYDFSSDGRRSVNL
jgi:hypothetical protein